MSEFLAVILAGGGMLKIVNQTVCPALEQLGYAMKEIHEIERKAVNRPVSELSRTAEKEIIGVITSWANSAGTPHSLSNGHHGHGHAETHAERVREALGNMYLDVTCSNCGSNKVIWAGACGVCTECGASQGCS